MSFSLIFLAPDGRFTVSLTPLKIPSPSGPKLVYDQKKDYNQYVVNHLFKFKISSNHSPPLPIPSGKIYCFVKNRLNLMGDEPVMMCEEHAKIRGTGGVLTSESPDMGLATLDGRHFGLVWTVPDLKGRTSYETSLGFTCCTHDSDHATKNTKWMLYFFGTGGFVDEPIMSDFENFKVMKVVRKCAEKPKPGIEKEKEKEKETGVRRTKKIPLEYETYSVLERLWAAKRRLKTLNIRLQDKAFQREGGFDPKELRAEIEEKTMIVEGFERKLAKINEGREEKIKLVDPLKDCVKMSDLARTKAEEKMCLIIEKRPDKVMNFLEKTAEIMNKPEVRKAMMVTDEDLEKERATRILEEEMRTSDAFLQKAVRAEEQRKALEEEEEKKKRNLDVCLPQLMEEGTESMDENEKRERTFEFFEDFEKIIQENDNLSG